MWADALDALARAEKLHRQLFQPSGSRAQGPNWEPPIDVLETDREVLILAALPGVAAGQVEAVIDGPYLIITGSRTVPKSFATAAIHRMELPQGRFERRIPLPRGVYERMSSQMVDGCLIVSLGKKGGN
jgi:HSP20 family molecular chaperone IbpA